jgi:hypothetical protein
MTNNEIRELSQKYCPRFGQLAVEFGFITEAQLIEALARQVHEELSGERHRLLGAILFESQAMSSLQIDQVSTELCKRMSQE